MNFEGKMDIGYGTQELRDVDFYHKHNSSSRKTRIDRIFTNIASARILQVFSTLENKAEYQDADGNTSNDLGHKPVLIRLGRDKKSKNNRKRFSCKNYKKAVIKFKPIMPTKPIGQDDNLKYINDTAEYLVGTAQNLVTQSMSTHKKSDWNPEELAIDLLDRAGDNIWKKKDAASRFYHMADEYMGKIKPDTTDAASKVPKLEQFKEFHEKKLSKILNPDIEKCEQIMHEIHGDKPKVHIAFPTKQEFKRLILSSSNSGALDIFGISLKQTKILFKHNKKLFIIYYSLCKAIAKHGVVPEIWKRDKVSFLFKHKGTTDDPKFYRPITVSCCFGKMFDKVLMSRWIMAMDLNADNNSYIAGRSCTSAIADVQNYLRDKREDAILHGLELLTFVCAEDISSAFESIAHRIIELYSELSFECDDFAMPKLVSSYLDRKSFVSERNSPELLEVVRTFLGQTSPQGSSNSPAWWRVFDGGFTKIFVELVDDMCKSDDRIHDFNHTSYADDKLIQITLNLAKFDDDESVKCAIAEISAKIRAHLVTATGTFGCAVNFDKSEILVPDYLVDKDQTIQNLSISMAKHKSGPFTGKVFKSVEKSEFL